MEQPESPRVLVPFMHGVGEIGAAATITLLRKAHCHVVTASVGVCNPIVGAQRMRFMADIDLSEALTEWGSDWDLILLLDGGKAVEGLLRSPGLCELLNQRLSAGGLIAALGAGIDVLVALGHRVVSEASVSAISSVGADEDTVGFPVVPNDEVVVDGSIITARRTDSAVMFALECVKALLGNERYVLIKQQIVAQA